MALVVSGNLRNMVYNFYNLYPDEVLTDEQVQQLNNLDVESIDKKYSLTVLASKFIEIMGDKYIDCVPDEALLPAGVDLNVEEDLPQETLSVQNTDNKSPVSDISMDIHELTMKTMQAVDQREPKYVVLEKDGNYVTTMESSDEVNTSDIAMASSLKEQDELVKNLTTALLEASEELDRDTAYNEPITQGDKNFIPSEIEIPHVVYVDKSPDISNSYKLISEKEINKLISNECISKSMIKELGALIGITCNFDDESTLSDIFAKVKNIIKQYDVENFKNDKLKANHDRMKAEYDEAMNKLLEANRFMSTHKDTQPLNKYVITLKYNDNNLFISDVSESTGLLVTRDIKKSRFYDSLVDASKVLDYLVENSSKLKLSEELLLTVSVKALCTSDV